MRLAEFLGEPDQQPLRPSDVAEPINVLVVDDFADELRAVRVQPFEGLADIVDGKHDAEVTQSVDRGSSMICDNGWSEEAGEFEPAVAVGRPHHGDLDMLVAETSDAPGPLALDHRPSFQFKAEFEKEIDHGIEVFDHDPDIVHSLQRHGSDLPGVVAIYMRSLVRATSPVEPSSHPGEGMTGGYFDDVGERV
ncbi:protein of unknown function (plasmid) [Shinella sp. WSC3-e]|nr:protein of unknown function [Shinella sp. WSC3-e]